MRTAIPSLGNNAIPDAALPDGACTVTEVTSGSGSIKKTTVKFTVDSAAFGTPNDRSTSCMVADFFTKVAAFPMGEEAACTAESAKSACEAVSSVKCRWHPIHNACQTLTQVVFWGTYGLGESSASSDVNVAIWNPCVEGGRG